MSVVYVISGVAEINLMAHIREVMGKHDKKKGQPSAKLLPARANQLQKVQEETERKIRLVNQNFEFPASLGDDGTRSKRGEHVINNGVITFYDKAFSEFMNQTINLGINYLEINTKKAIETELVVYFDEDELYINANALIYGQYCRVLKRALKDFLTLDRQVGRRQDDGNVAQNNVTRIVQDMNREEAYVDEYAKVKWIGNRGARQTRFQNIQNEVATMFSNWNQYCQSFTQQHPA